MALDSNELLMAGDDPIWEQVSAQESVRIIKEILSELPQDDQDMLIYKVVYEWSNQEIADVMGISANYVSVRLSRVRKKVMNKYHESEDGVR
ncbi:sigma-70 family RNA polymerase sigma factor [Pseudomonas otitidis]|uniref:Sigma-70 family RNA polymerase sigma factor n=1 Tax=Metapseudomonas otitidis TaxID=319939 RepID=A0A7X3HEP6_9GAMM|nr:sigma-70 family RNA polymerase sigma factor [Pseudomonas otitidis]